jgi:DNA-binding transcriptional LysR family regulator
VALTDEGEMLLGDARRLLQLEEAARHPRSPCGKEAGLSIARERRYRGKSRAARSLGEA